MVDRPAQEFPGLQRVSAGNGIRGAGTSLSEGIRSEHPTGLDRVRGGAGTHSSTIVNDAAAMNFIVVRAVAGSRLGLEAHDPQVSARARLTVLLCERATAVVVPAGVVALLCPIAGGVGVMTTEWSTRLSRGDICVGDAQTRHDVVISARGACIVVAGTPAAWAASDRKGASGAQPGTVLFPAIHRSVRGCCRRLVRFTRDCMRDAHGASGKHHAHLLLGLVEELQSGFAATIARCPGSSLSRKKAVFLRLQRVRNHISACAHQDLDVAKLALMANYSVGHFITTFRSVFDETPYSNVSRSRLESASTLLSESKLGIGDIAQAIGYQSRSSFTRAIRKYFGSSATQVRENFGSLAIKQAEDMP
jgi:AraC family transcriptional regulator